MAFWSRHPRPDEIAEAEANGPEQPPISRELAEFVEAVHLVNTTDDPRYVAAVAAIRQEGPSRVEEISAIWASLPTGGGGLRRGLVMAAEQIDDPAAVQFLVAVALNWDPPVGASDATGCHGSRSAATAEGIRAQAVAALQTRAASGADEALEALSACIARGSRTVRALGVVALREVDSDGDRFRTATAQLGTEYHDLLALHRIGVREAPQARRPGENLSGHSNPSGPAPRIDSIEPWKFATGQTPSVAGRSNG